MFRAALGNQHPDVASTLNGIGTVHHAMGDHKSALEKHSEALAILMATLPATHPKVAVSLPTSPSPCWRWVNPGARWPNFWMRWRSGVWRERPWRREEETETQRGKKKKKKKKVCIKLNETANQWSDRIPRLRGKDSGGGLQSAGRRTARWRTVVETRACRWGGVRGAESDRGAGAARWSTVVDRNRPSAGPGRGRRSCEGGGGGGARCQAAVVLGGVVFRIAVDAGA
jgi:hypothetical protein